MINNRQTINISDNLAGSTLETAPMNTRYRKHIAFILYGIVVIEYIRMLASSGKIAIGGSTYLFALIEYLSLIILFKTALGTRLGNDIPFSIKVSYLFWLAINLLNFLRGGIIAENYWDYKFLLLVSFSFSVISLVFYLGVNHTMFSFIYRRFYVTIVPMALMITPVMYYYNHESFARIAIPITFFLCILPYVSYKTKVLIIAIALTSVLLALDFRTNVIKTAVACGTLLLYFLSKKTTPLLFNLAQKVLFIVPICILILGLSGTFNIFTFMSQQDLGSTTNTTGRKISFSGDTRTFLYKEVISSVMQSDNWLLGESSSGSYRSIFFFNSGGAINDRRYASEVGILNIFLYHGILGCVAYCLLLYFVSITAITQSNNYLSKMLGLLIASRWTLSFIEEFTRFDMNFFFFWLIMGLISTKSFRSLTDQEVAQFFRISHKMPQSYHRFQKRLVGRG